MIIKSAKQSFLAGLAVCAAVPGIAADKPLDFWAEEIRLFGVAGRGGHVDASVAQRRLSNYKANGFVLDHADHVEGDLSILYTPGSIGMPERFGFVAGLWGETWALSGAMQLRLWAKVQDQRASRRWRIYLVDAADKVARGEIDGIQDEWKELTLPLSALQAAAGFDWDHVKLCEFEGAFGPDARIHLDGVRFQGMEILIGVTEKTMSQRRAEAERTRGVRVRQAFEQAASGKEDANNAVVIAFAKMMLNQDLDTANRLLVEELKKSSDNDAWSLLHTPLYCRFYYMFGSRCGQFPGRLTPATEKRLLETLWERTRDKNDIYWARQSTWWLDGSENHDLNAKACNLVTSRIFMNEPDYKERIYPDYGFGGSYHYGHAGYYGPGIDPASRHGGGRANLSDGTPYKAADHYKAWLAFLQAYFRERAQRGFFLEYAAPGYSKHVLNMVDLAYQYGGDAALHALVGDFLTLYWADWAQVSISGIRGGPKTRHHDSVGGAGQDSGTADLVTFYLGGPGNAGVWWYWNLLNDYRLPAIVWRLALDRQGLGTFIYQARGIGEEENVLPRPLGTERSLLVDTDARFLKYTYVTPDYTLGTQMDHPSAVHSHLSPNGRWHGMTFAQSASARIVPVSLTADGYNTHKKASFYDMNAQYQTAQSGRTLICQQSRRWYAVHPPWFKTPVPYDQAVGIWFGTAWDRRAESGGWIFVQSGNAYAAVRPVLADMKYEEQTRKKDPAVVFFNVPNDAPTVKLRTDCYRWNEDHSILLLEDNHTATIIEAGSKRDYPTLEAFMADVLDNPITLYKTVVPGANILVYTGCGKDAKEMVFNCGVAEIPTIGGEPVKYGYPMTFDSPYLKAEYKSGKIRLAYGGDTLDLDFSANLHSPTGDRSN